MNDKQMMKWLKGNEMIEGINFICFKARYHHFSWSLFWACNNFKIKMQVVCVYTVAMGKDNIERHLETHQHTQKTYRINYVS